MILFFKPYIIIYGKIFTQDKISNFQNQITDQGRFDWNINSRDFYFTEKREMESK